MTEISKAWVWTQYKGVAEDHSQGGALPLFGASSDGAASAASKRLKWGASLAAAMLVGLIFPKIAFLLLIFAGLLVLSGMEPTRFENFCKEIPGGSFILKILALADVVLP